MTDDVSNERVNDVYSDQRYNQYKPPSSYDRSTSYNKPTKQHKQQYNEQKKYSTRPHTTSKPKSKKKCPRKLSLGGMPEFEHFPLKEIMKEGVNNDGSDDECVDMPFGSFDDWTVDDNDDYNRDYDHDYVQPTRKPLIFKELLNTKPLSKRKYESKR